MKTTSFGVLALALVGMAGCSKSDNNATTTTSDATTVQAPAPAPSTDTVVTTNTTTTDTIHPSASDTTKADTSRKAEPKGEKMEKKGKK